MKRVFKSSSVVLAAVGLMLVGSVSAMAQSGSRNYPPSRSSRPAAPQAGSGQRAHQQAPLTLEGYCPVSIVAMQKWVKGDPAYQAAYDGRSYLFADERGKRMFQADPAKYVPALGGDCAVALVKLGKRVPGSIRHASFHDGRLFLFANADAHKMFQAEPAAYANADLALGGTCPVCLVNMRQSVAGKPEIAAFHKGFRYLFPAAEQRHAFLASPEKYVSAAGNGAPTKTGSATRQSTSGSSTRPPVRSGSGSR
jgi:YHS domain-containing protein